MQGIYFCYLSLMRELSKINCLALTQLILVQQIVLYIKFDNHVDGALKNRFNMAIEPWQLWQYKGNRPGQWSGNHDRRWTINMGNTKATYGKQQEQPQLRVTGSSYIDNLVILQDIAGVILGMDWRGGILKIVYYSVLWNCIFIHFLLMGAVLNIIRLFSVWVDDVLMSLHTTSPESTGVWLYVGQLD